jgi:hypothetical protein
MSHIFADFYFDPYFCGFRDIQLLVRGLYIVHIQSFLHFLFHIIMTTRYESTVFLNKQLVSECT